MAPGRTIRTELYRSYHGDGDSPQVTHHVLLYTQPPWRHLTAQAYHWYDAHIEQIPGVHRLEHFLDRFTGVDAIPFCARRDLRCYRLARAGRHDLAELDLDADTYTTLGGSHA